MGNQLIPPELMRLVASGDEQAFEQLYKLTYRPVYAFLLSLTKNKEEAEDLMQETYLRVHGSSHLYKEQGNAMAWIMKIGKNLFLMEERRKRPLISDIRDPMESIEFVSSGIEDAETRMIMDELFTRLGDDERTIIILHVQAGFRHKEISDIMSMPIGTVISKYNRALKKLEQAYTEVIEGV